MRCGIQAVRPNDCASLVIDARAAKVVEITQRLAEIAVEQEGDIDVAHDAIVDVIHATSYVDSPRSDGTVACAAEWPPNTCVVH